MLAVIDIQGSRKDARYSLRPRHWELARTHLLFGQQIPVIPLAAFLYRDYGVNTSDDPTAAHLTAIFRTEFGYSPESAASANDEFDHLYTRDTEPIPASSWYQVAGQ